MPSYQSVPWTGACTRLARMKPVSGSSSLCCRQCQRRRELCAADMERNGPPANNFPPDQSRHYKPHPGIPYITDLTNTSRFQLKWRRKCVQCAVADEKKAWHSNRFLLFVLRTEPSNGYGTNKTFRSVIFLTRLPTCGEQSAVYWEFFTTGF